MKSEQKPRVKEKGRETFSIIRCFIEFSFLQRYENTERVIRSVLFRLKWEKNEIRHVFDLIENKCKTMRITKRKNGDGAKAIQAN